jgi:hypothetical protein
MFAATAFASARGKLSSSRKICVMICSALAARDQFIERPREQAAIGAGLWFAKFGCPQRPFQINAARTARPATDCLAVAHLW